MLVKANRGSLDFLLVPVLGSAEHQGALSGVLPQAMTFQASHGKNTAQGMGEPGAATKAPFSREKGRNCFLLIRKFCLYPRNT